MGKLIEWVCFVVGNRWVGLQAGLEPIAASSGDFAILCGDRLVHRIEVKLDRFEQTLLAMTPLHRAPHVNL